MQESSLTLSLSDVVNSDVQEFFLINKDLNPNDFEYRGVHFGYHTSKEKELKHSGKDELNGNFNDVDMHAKISFLENVLKYYPGCVKILKFVPGFFVSTCITQDPIHQNESPYSAKKWMKYELFYSMTGLAVIPKKQF